MTAADTNTRPRLIPRPKVAKELGVTVMTLWRWEKNPELEFPPWTVINGRLYMDESELDKWKAARVRGDI